MHKILSNIKERILYLAEIKGIAKNKFIESIGMSYGNFNGSQRKRPLNSDAVNNILSKNPDINPEWLLTGKGAIFRDSSDESVSSSKDTLNVDVTQCAEFLSEKDKLISSLERLVQDKDERIALLTEQKNEYRTIAKARESQTQELYEIISDLKKMSQNKKNINDIVSRLADIHLKIIG